MSIPIRSKASSQIRANTDIQYTYSDGYGYQFFVGSGLPDPYYFNSDVLDYVIQKSAEGKFFELNSYLGTKINNIASNIFNSVFSLFYNAQTALDKGIQDWISSSWGVYQWKFDCTGINPDYPGYETYGTAYGFRFEGALGEKIDIVLDSNGDFYGTNPIGNYTFNTDPDIVQWIGIHQENPDPTDPSFYMPSIYNVDFNSMLAPYFEGNKLFFYVYENNVPILCSFDNVVNCAFVCNPSWAWYGSGVWVGLIDGKSTYGTIPVHTFTYGNNSINFTQEDASNIWKYFTVKNSTYTGYIMFVKLNNYFQNISSNLPFYKGSSNNTFPNNFDYSNYNVSGVLNGTFVSGSGPSLFLQKMSYTPTINPPELPDSPVPITSIPSDPDTPIPDSDPDPVPGITYPVNPTPPPLRPVPSIVSGNDDLWPSVVELQNIEIDLSGYLSSLGDFEFPDLTTITESFAGSIVWVSALMSTLFNGSDFSILFAVLSSFFIVAALLGLYKWWNHK